MDFTQFRRILTTFADNPSDMDFSKGHLVVQIRDELIEVDLRTRDGSLFVVEEGEEQTAHGWLVRRVARLQQLADRIISYVDTQEHFVIPSGMLLDQIEVDPDDEPDHTDNAVGSIRSVLDRRPGGTSSVLYLTSDAGEGKTTTINHLARQQANEYKNRRTDWLLVPVTLGGRGFSRFDDVVIAALVNKLRFQLLYYDAFLELVRMGVLVPAFDGFEEMFVESGSGEALSALGNLVGALDSAGSVLIAARKAYFEYKSLTARAKLFETIKRDSVSFSRLALLRWERSHFISYAEKRGVGDADELFQHIAARLGEHHPMLTRAVLVRRLIDIAQSNNLDALLLELGKAPQDYFFQFVNTIIEREAHEKWIDRSGTPLRPLLTVDEHHELLALIAQEMWLGTTEALRTDVIDTIAEVFAEHTSKSPLVARQIKERLPHHSLLAAAEARAPSLVFDHEDFRKFFLGIAIGRALEGRAESEIRPFLQVATLPPDACDAAVTHMRRMRSEIAPVVDLLVSIGAADVSTSFTRENCGALVIRLLDTTDVASTIHDLTFPPDALRGRQLTRPVFERCYFQPTSLDGTSLTACSLVECRFDRLDVGQRTRIIDTLLQNSEVIAVYDYDEERQVYDPSNILVRLARVGFKFPPEQTVMNPVEEIIFEDELVTTEKTLRLFWRATHLNESAIRQRLGVKANQFFDDLLPELLRAGVLDEIAYTGSGRQRRFRLGVPMEKLERALQNSHGLFQTFVEQAAATAG